MKKIVLFSDGTGNSAASPHKTNVWRAYQALDRSPGSNQIAFYDNGVGTSSFTPTALLGLAFGVGLARNVKQIYGFLCRTYEDGDEIYGFGFSRGAFTMRVAVALIASQGIIDREVPKSDRDMDRLIAAAYRRFRHENFRPSFLSFFLRPLRDAILKTWYAARGCTAYDPSKNLKYDEPDAPSTILIKFLGVWDTVDAYGLPIDEFTRAWDRVVWPLTAKDRDLSPRIARACQALALDEQRESFEPMLWNEKGAAVGPTIDDEDLSQVWFPGVHADVGGGYPDDALALASLNWILDQSQKNSGLKYCPPERQRFGVASHAHGPLHDSRSGIGNFYRYAPRNLERLCHEKKPGLSDRLMSTVDKTVIAEKLGGLDVSENVVNIIRPKIHHSVFERLTEAGDAYAPINIPSDYAMVDQTGAVVSVTDTGTVATKLPEGLPQAETRRRRQSYAWNKVWARKIIYYLTLILIVCFVTFPYWPKNITDKGSGSIAKWIEPVLGTLGVAIRAIPSLIGKIPGFGFAGNWAMEYDKFPFVFSLGALIIGACLMWSWKINAALRDEMRANWHHVTGKGASPPDTVSAFRRSFARFLEGPIYIDKIRWSIRFLLESAAFLIFLLLVLAACSRLYFGIGDGFGQFCPSNTQVEQATFGEEFTFNPTNTCHATGLKLRKGEKYAIEMRVAQDWGDKLWLHNAFKADVNGWTSTPWYMSLFIPIRRHLFASWVPANRTD